MYILWNIIICAEGDGDLSDVGLHMAEINKIDSYMEFKQFAVFRVAVSPHSTPSRVLAVCRCRTLKSIETAILRPFFEQFLIDSSDGNIYQPNANPRFESEVGIQREST